MTTLPVNKENPEYFKQIFNSFYSPLCNYAYKIVNNKSEAEDIVQELFIQLYEKQSLLKVHETERYLIRSTKLKCIDYIRKRKKNLKVNYSQIPDLDKSSISELSEEDIEPLMHYFAAKLPPKTRKVFLLSRVSEKTYREISQELNISQKTVEVQMGRALRHLRELLKQNDFFSIIISLFF
jgi:RNA polymerase sigma-70 factor (family 1)